MNEELAEIARRILTAAPASIEMPAGTGKTHLLSAAVSVAALKGKRSLVLTHTNAGVNAIRKRLRKFGVANTMVRVETLTSWALRIVRSYPIISGCPNNRNFDDKRADEYIAGATRALKNMPVKQVHVLSFAYLFVDEYQDCTRIHHAFVKSLSDAIPKTVVFGDPLQTIFGFAGPLADWEDDVIPHYPRLELEHIPHRWKTSNPALGDWLLSVRDSLRDGLVFNATGHEAVGIRYVPTGKLATLTVASVVDRLRKEGETHVILVAYPKQMKGYAQKLSGRAFLMEDVNGSFMREWIERGGDLSLPQEGDPLLALWLAKFLKECAVGAGPIDERVCEKLKKGETLLKLKNKPLMEIKPVVDALECLRENPTYEQLVKSAIGIGSLTTPTIYRREAWRDTIEAIKLTTVNGLAPIENFERVRERLRWQSRSQQGIIISRPVLVKGLEYDHIIISTLGDFADPRVLYVALSRARKSVTIVGEKPEIVLKRK